MPLRHRYYHNLTFDHSYYQVVYQFVVIQGVYPGQAYIAAQGAMPDTVVDFWKMLWENDVKTVVMACNEYEGIPRKVRF